MTAVLLANARMRLALSATSVCKRTLPQCPPSKESSCVDKTGSAALSCCKRVESNVSKGLVAPMVMTTRKSAILMIFLRGVFIEGESWEMLSRPEKARKAPANPTRIEGGVRDACSNILAKRNGNSEMGIWVKTVQMLARSLTKATRAPSRLTFALSLMPTQLRMPRRTSTLMVISKIKGAMAGNTTLKYWMADRELIAAVRK